MFKFTKTKLIKDAESINLLFNVANFRSDVSYKSLLLDWLISGFSIEDYCELLNLSPTDPIVTWFYDLPFRIENAATWDELDVYKKNQHYDLHHKAKLISEFKLRCEMALALIAG